MGGEDRNKGWSTLSLKVVNKQPQEEFPTPPYKVRSCENDRMGDLCGIVVIPACLESFFHVAISEPYRRGLYDARRAVLPAV